MKKIIIGILFFTFLFSQSDTLEAEKIKKKNYKSYFVASEVALGIGIYSWLLPVGLGLKDRLAVVVGLWTPAISFFASSRIRYVKASGAPLQAFFGGIGGMCRGIIFAEKMENKFTLPLFFSLTENIGGYFLSEKLQFGVEDAWRFLNFNGLGIFHAAMIHILTGEDWKNYKYFYPILSAFEGYLGSILLSKEENITFGDAFCELDYARLGVTSPIAFLGGMELLTKQDFFNKNSVTIFSLIGSCVGYYFGHKRSRERDLSFGDALIINFAPRMIEGIVIGTAILIFKDYWGKREWGITLLVLSIADPIGTYLIDKKIK
ncbi:MAG: hypothetical protein N2323_03285 [candidate division WOR-3 bacterium]|nr:hypothetical protein [candidate division WOR-3 bacterium]MCX7836965.1 hypothetical protein [candidate division WOR-3 bacterium]MDW8114093.1 hypothetical protein [candidate division WOR-3 bacterium]